MSGYFPDEAAASRTKSDFYDIGFIGLTRRPRETIDVAGKDGHQFA